MVVMDEDPFVGPSHRFIREASFVYPLQADEVLHPKRCSDLEDVLQPFFGAYAHSRVVQRAIATVVEDDRCQKLEVQVSSRNETGRMRSLGVASRTRQERIYKVVLDQIAKVRRPARAIRAKRDGVCMCVRSDNRSLRTKLFLERRSRPRPTKSFHAQRHSRFSDAASF